MLTFREAMEALTAEVAGLRAEGSTQPSTEAIELRGLLHEVLRLLREQRMSVENRLILEREAGYKDGYERGKASVYALDGKKLEAFVSESAIPAELAEEFAAEWEPKFKGLSIVGSGPSPDPSPGREGDSE